MEEIFDALRVCLAADRFPVIASLLKERVQEKKKLDIAYTSGDLGRARQHHARQLRLKKLTTELAFRLLAQEY